MKPKATAHYQNVLRAIGQGLENLQVNSFDLEFSDGHYIVSGNCKNSKTPVVHHRSVAKSFLSLVRNVSKKTTPNPSLPFHFSGLCFAPRDIERLDQKGKALRSSWDGSPPNPHSVAQVLRMTGTYLDHNGSLLRLSWRHPILTLWYVNKLGIEMREEFTPPDLYDVWVHQFKKRKPVRVLKPTGSD